MKAMKYKDYNWGLFISDVMFKRGRTTKHYRKQKENVLRLVESQKHI